MSQYNGGALVRIGAVESEMLYRPWQKSIFTPYWALDRHWYSFLGWLYAGNGQLKAETL